MEGIRYKEYETSCRRKTFLIMLFIGVLVVLFIASLTVGFFKISFVEVIDVIVRCLSGEEVSRQERVIIWDGRVPEAICAILAGAALSTGGAIMQTTLRNPLADPYTMGISSGASFGVSIAAILGISIIPGAMGNYAIIFNAFLFSLIPVGIILMVSRKRSMTPTKIILTGIAVMYLFSAVTTLLMLTAESEKLADVYAWRVGTLALMKWEYIPPMALITLLGICFLFFNNKKYNVIMAGNESAKSMGVNVKRETMYAMTVISLMTASVVCFTGTIGFIGLVGPHMARMFIGSESKYLIPASALFGATFLLFADCVARVTGSVGLPVGVVSALIGCPLFIWMLVKMRSKEWK